MVISLRDMRGEESLKKVAEEIGITHQMLSALESGRRKPSVPVAVKIACYHKVSLIDVLGIFFELDCNDSLQSKEGQRISALA